MTHTAFGTRFGLSLSMLLYAMLLGCFRTGVLGSIVGNKPGSGGVSFGSDVSISVSRQTHGIVRAACLTALVVIG